MLPGTSLRIQACSYSWWLNRDLELGPLQLQPGPGMGRGLLRPSTVTGACSVQAQGSRTCFLLYRLNG